MDHPLLTHHSARVAELYSQHAVAMLANLARTGVTATAAAAGVTHAFEQLAERPDLTTGNRAPIAWLTSVARNEANRLDLADAAPPPAPTATEAPDLLAALAGSKKARKAAKKAAAQQRTPTT